MDPRKTPSERLWRWYSGSRRVTLGNCLLGAVLLQTLASYVPIMIASHGDVLYRIVNRTDARDANGHPARNADALTDDDTNTNTARSLLFRLTLLLAYVFVVVPLSIIFSSLLLLVISLTLLDYFLEAAGAILVTMVSLGSVMSFDCRATYETFIHFLESITGPLCQDSRLIIRCRRNPCLCDHHLSRCAEGTCYKVHPFVVGRRVYVLCSCFRRHVEKWVELSGDTNMFVRCFDQGQSITEVSFPLMMESSMQKVIDLGCGHFDATLLERTYDKYVYSWTSTTLRTYSEREEEEFNQQLENQVSQKQVGRHKEMKAFTTMSVSQIRNNVLGQREIPEHRQHIDMGPSSFRFRRPCRSAHAMNGGIQADMSSGHVSLVTPNESQIALDDTDSSASSKKRVHIEEKEVDDLLKHSSSSYDHDFFNLSHDDGPTHTHPTSSTKTKPYNASTSALRTQKSAPPPSSSDTYRLPAMLEISRAENMRFWLDEFIELHLPSDTVNDLGSCFHPLSFSYLRDAFISGHGDSMQFYHILVLKALGLVAVTVIESVRVFQTGGSGSDDEGDAPMVLRSIFVIVIIATVIQVFPHNKPVTDIGGIRSEVWNMLAKMSLAVGSKLHVFAKDHSRNKYRCFGTTGMGRVTFMENVLFNKSVTVVADRPEDSQRDGEDGIEDEDDRRKRGGKKKKKGYMFNFSRIGTAVRTASLATNDEEQVVVKHWGIVPNRSWDKWYPTIPKTVWVTNLH